MYYFLVISVCMQTILASLLLHLISSNNFVLFPTLVTHLHSHTLDSVIPNNCNIYIILIKAETYIGTVCQVLFWTILFIYF